MLLVNNPKGNPPEDTSGKAELMRVMSARGKSDQGFIISQLDPTNREKQAGAGSWRKLGNSRDFLSLPILEIDPGTRTPSGYVLFMSFSLSSRLRTVSLPIQHSQQLRQALPCESFIGKKAEH
ncbi:unnamed protein product [Allacma fusca]|uniref:Uncharacterized protein n=1 Tax=Allacma fusca TaxID=39272 RepID=A0A8J2K6B4_9HEXA|nr:unnamed protein product [Allacma fusca]